MRISDWRSDVCSSDLDLSEATRLRVQAFRAAAVAAEQEARNLSQNASAYEKLQVEIDRAAASSGRLANEAQQAATSNSRLALSQGALRPASTGATRKRARSGNSVSVR